MNIIVAILGISFLVIVHETGHYLAARAFGMRVLRYSIGLGPVLFKYQPKGSPTIFQVCAIPFLAYVQIDGMNPADEVDRNDPALFPNKGVLARMITIFAGPFANYLAASLIVFGVVAIDGAQEPVENPPMVVGNVVPDSPAARAGIQVGDRIVEADHQAIGTLQDLVEVTRDRAGQPTEYVIERGGERLAPMTITPGRSEDGRGIIGVSGPSVYVDVPLGDAAKIAVVWPAVVTIGTLDALWTLIRQGRTDGISGPVGMVRAASQHAERGLRQYIEFIAQISIGLGLLNLLPLPALDGGRLVFLAFELVTRRRANERVEAMVHTVGLLFLLGVIVLVTFRDVLG